MESTRATENERPLDVLGFAGSLRAGSYNRALLSTAQELAPAGMNVEVFDLAPLPLYNADLDTDADRPAPVERFKAAIAGADALLVTTPEYNHSVSGVLKNAIDWASRPGHASVLKGKPVAMMGASPSAVGTARAQEHLKPIFDSTLSRVMPHPGVVVASAHEKFDAEGHLTDEDTRAFAAGFLDDFGAYAEEVRARRGRGAQEA